MQFVGVDKGFVAYRSSRMRKIHVCAAGVDKKIGSNVPQPDSGRQEQQGTLSRIGGRVCLLFVASSLFLHGCASLVGSYLYSRTDHAKCIEKCGGAWFADPVCKKRCDEEFPSRAPSK